MNQLVSNIKVYWILLLVLPFFMDVGIVSVFYFGIFILWFFTWGKMKVNKRLINILFPLFIIICIGLINFTDYDLIMILRDLQYPMGIVAGLLIGYICSYSLNSDKFIKILIMVCTIVCTALLMRAFYLLFSDGIVSFMEWKQNIGGGSGAPVIGATLILLTIGGKNLTLSKKLYLLAGLTICLLSVIIPMTRVWIFTFTLLIFINFNLYKKPLRLLVFGLISIILFYSIYTLATNTIYIEYFSAFLEKLKNSINEMAITQRPTRHQIGINWRGYESYLALNQYYNGNLINWMFGFGFGKTIETNYTLWLLGKQYTELLVFHNGYVYILIKSGIVGLTFYMIFHFLILIKSFSIYKSTAELSMKLLAKLSFSLIISILFTTMVLKGFVGPRAYLLSTIIIGYVVTNKINTESPNLSVI